MKWRRYDICCVNWFCTSLVLMVMVVMECVHVFRPSRCFERDTLQPSLCHKFRYPACSPTHFSAHSLIAMHPGPKRSTTATPPLTSPGNTVQQWHTSDYNPLNTLSNIWTVCELTVNSHSACSLFGNWSERKQEKLRAIMHYFNVVTDESKLLLNLLSFLFVRHLGENPWLLFTSLQRRNQKDWWHSRGVAWVPQTFPTGEGNHLSYLFIKHFSKLRSAKQNGFDQRFSYCTYSWR